jgi:hypothetical protein
LRLNMSSYQYCHILCHQWPHIRSHARDNETRSLRGVTIILLFAGKSAALIETSLWNFVLPNLNIRIPRGRNTTCVSIAGTLPTSSRSCSRWPSRHFSADAADAYGFVVLNATQFSPFLQNETFLYGKLHLNSLGWYTYCDVLGW